MEKQEQILLYETSVEVTNLKDTVLRHNEERKNDLHKLNSKLDSISTVLIDNRIEILERINSLKIEGITSNFKLWAKVAGLSATISLVVIILTTLITASLHL